jgi:hypothetical protein
VNFSARRASLSEASEGKNLARSEIKYGFKISAVRAFKRCDPNIVFVFAVFGFLRRKKLKEAHGT